MQPFTIHCTTCQRSLRVTSPDAIGQILACPKCGSMVMVEPPAGWSPGEPESAPAQSGTPSATPALLSASTFVPPAPAKATPRSATPAAATPGSIAAGPANALPAAAKATAWKDPPPSATPVGETLPKAAAHRHRTPARAPSAAEVVAAPPIAGASNASSVPITSTAKAQPSQVEPARAEVTAEPAADAWPRWFLPGVVATVALGVVLFMLRLLLQSPGSNAEDVAVAPPVQTAGDSSADAATRSSNHQRPPIGEDSSTALNQQPATDQDAAIADGNSQQPAEISSAAPSASPHEPTANSPPGGNGSIAAAPVGPTLEPSASTPDSSTKPLSPNTPANPAVAAPPALAQPSATAPNGAAPPAALPPDIPSPEATPPSGNEIAKSDVASPPAGMNEKPAPIEKPPAPSLQRVPPRQANLEARLADSLKGLDVANMPLNQFVELMSEISAVPIAMNLDALEQLNRSPTAPITVRAKAKTVAETLEAALSPLGLGYDMERGLLVIGHPQREAMRQVSYTVTDLVGNDAKALEDLAALVRQLIAPHTWQQNGGKASMTTSTAGGNSKIAIEQTPAVHYNLLVFCEKLRIARALPLKSHYDPAKFSLTSAEAKAHKLLTKPITANFGGAHTLASVVEWLRRNTKATILIDYAALADMETSAESQCSIVADHKPLAAMLDELLKPMDLTWRAVDASTIEITTLQAAADHDQIEFFPMPELARDPAAGNTLAEQVKAQLAPASADPQLGIVVHFDVPSGSLIVRAPQRLQAQVEESLATRPAKN